MRRQITPRVFVRPLTWAAGVFAVCGAIFLAFMLLQTSSSHHATPKSVLRVGAGPQRCVYTSESIAGLERFDALTGSETSCAEVFDNDSSWSTWTRPWFLPPSSPDTSWARWVGEMPARQLTIAQQLIPDSLAGSDWLAQGSEGRYTNYARRYARNLIAAGLGHAIIRLGPEANGTWEQDTLPDSASGMAQWREFWRKTVEAMRSVPGAAFRFDWTVNALERPIELSRFYPGDAVVDIVGVDAYEPDPSSASWHQLLTGTDGLSSVAAFARSHGKPLSLPEWGTTAGSPSATAQYINGIARLIRNNDVAYESYFYAHQFESALTQRSIGLKAFHDDFGHA